MLYKKSYDICVCVCVYFFIFLFFILIFLKHICGDYNFQIWSSYASSRGGQSSFTQMMSVFHNELECQFRHFWFEVLPKLLKMDDPCNGQHPRHENLLPPSLSDLL